MRALTPALLASSLSFWAPGRAIVITRVDGTVLRLAEMMTAQTFGGNTFLPGTGLIVGSIPLTLNEEAANVDFDVVAHASDGVIDMTDVMDGLYRGASVEIYAINRFTPADGLGLLFSGTIGAIQRKSNGRVTMQVIGPLGKAALELGHKFSPTCRAILGDAMCRVDLDPFKVIGTVTATGSGHALPISGFTHSDPMYDPRGGYFEVQTGRMKGFKFEFARPGFSAFLYLPVGGLFEAGDTLWIFPDCTYEPNDAGCVFYSNIINFVGEPFMFGAQSLTGGINSLGSTGLGSDLPPGAGPGDFGDFNSAGGADDDDDFPLSLTRQIVVSDFLVPDMLDPNGVPAIETDVKEFHFTLMEFGGYFVNDPAVMSFDMAAVLYSAAGNLLGKSSVVTKLPNTITSGFVTNNYTAVFLTPVRVAIGDTIKVGIQGRYYKTSQPDNPDYWNSNTYDVMLRLSAGVSHYTEELSAPDPANPPAVLPADTLDHATNKIAAWIRSTPVMV